jgi:acetyl esterase
VTRTVEFRVENVDVIGRDGVIRVRDYLPAVDSSSGSTPFLWIHGGGFAAGGLDQEESDAPARFLAATGRRVRTVDYRLVSALKFFTGLGRRPNLFPAALHDVVDVATDLAAITGGRISVGGASAGANLAASAALMIRDGGHLDLTALVLAYGAFHAVLPEDAEVERALRGPVAHLMFTPAMTRRVYVNYVGDPSLLVPGYAVPGGADLHSLPPTLLLNADNDRLRSSGHAFADELRAAAVEVHEEVVAGRHGFLNSTRTAGFAERMQTIESWLRAHDT